MRAIVRILAVGALALAVAAPSAALAHRHRPASVVARGACSGEAVWRLALATDGPRLGVAFRVDASVAGELGASRSPTTATPCSSPGAWRRSRTASSASASWSATTRAPISSGPAR